MCQHKLKINVSFSVSRRSLNLYFCRQPSSIRPSIILSLSFFFFTPHTNLLKQASCFSFLLSYFFPYWHLLRGDFSSDNGRDLLSPKHSETKSFSSEDHGPGALHFPFHQTTQQHLCSKALKNDSACFHGRDEWGTETDLTRLIIMKASELVAGTKFQKNWTGALTQLDHMKSWQEISGFSRETKIQESVSETGLSPKQ